MWKDTEKDCFNYLVNHYERNGVKFTPMGDSDSTQSDILVTTRKSSFYIEVKSPDSQCGQFVLFPDDKTKSFVFSSQNKVRETNNSRKIMDLMNNQYSYYSTGDDYKYLPEGHENLYWDWVVDCYKNKDCKYVITKDRHGVFILFPLEKIREYFSIKGVFRIKKSGSSDLPKKYDDLIESILSSYSPESSFERRGKSFYVKNYKSSNYSFEQDDFSVLLVREKPSEYKVRKLSNTFNKNVIFTINLSETNKKSYWESLERELYLEV